MTLEPTFIAGDWPVDPTSGRLLCTPARPMPPDLRVGHRWLHVEATEIDCGCDCHARMRCDACGVTWKEARVTAGDLKPGDLVTWHGCLTLKWGGHGRIASVGKMGTLSVEVRGPRGRVPSKLTFQKRLRGGYERGLRLLSQDEVALLVANGWISKELAPYPAPSPSEENAGG